MAYEKWCAFCSVEYVRYGAYIYIYAAVSSQSQQAVATTKRVGYLSYKAKGIHCTRRKCVLIHTVWINTKNRNNKTKALGGRVCTKQKRARFQAQLVDRFCFIFLQRKAMHGTYYYAYSIAQTPPRGALRHTSYNIHTYIHASLTNKTHAFLSFFRFLVTTTHRLFIDI